MEQRGLSLLDLPEVLLLKISQGLPCQDLPALVCTCRATANLGKDFYQACLSLDMRWFPWVDPFLCDQMLRRLGGGSLQSLWFSFSVFKYDTTFCAEALQMCQVLTRYSSDVETRVLARYPSQVFRDCPSDRLLTKVLYGRALPRPMDVMVHALYLEEFLRNFPHLTTLHVDCETDAQIWPYAKNLQESLIVSGNAAKLEVYHRHSRYVTNREQAECHAAVAGMLTACPRLKQLATPIPLTSASLATYDSVGSLPNLQSAHVCVGRLENNHTTIHQIQTLATKLPHLTTLSVEFKEHPWLHPLKYFLRALPSIKTLHVAPETLPIHHKDDVNATQEGSNLETLLDSLPPTITSLHLTNFTRPDFVASFASSRQLPKSLTHFSMSIITWPAPEVDEDAKQLLLHALNGPCALTSYSIEVSTGLRCRGSDVIFIHANEILSKVK